MLALELLFVAMLLLRVAASFVRVLVLLHAALILVALPAGLLVRAGAIRDVDAFATVSCAWAALLLGGWFAAPRRWRAEQGPGSAIPRGSPRRSRGGRLRGSRGWRKAVG